jgi:hypothetical protein
LERNRRTSLEPQNTKTGTQIIASDTSVGKDGETPATLLYAVYVYDRAISAIIQCDVIIQINQIAQRLGAEFNPVAHAASSSIDPHAAPESWQRLDLPEALDRGQTSWRHKHQ